MARLYLLTELQYGILKGAWEAVGLKSIEHMLDDIKKNQYVGDSLHSMEEILKSLKAFVDTLQRIDKKEEE